MLENAVLAAKPLPAPDPHAELGRLSPLVATWFFATADGRLVKLSVHSESSIELRIGADDHVIFDKHQAKALCAVLGEVR